MPKTATFSIKKHNDFLRMVSDFFESGTDAQHRNFCKKHHIEHIGKTAYSIGIDLYLYDLYKDEQYYTRAYNRAFRVSSQLKQVNNSYVYLPDGDERWNMSQRVIDAGAATDMLATFLLKVGHKVTKEEYEVLADTVTKNADTYLVDASVHKAPTNQRLWGATGLASAYTLLQKEEWTEALRASVERSLSEIRADGSIPYITAYEGYADASYKEITPFYHSRHAAYAWHVLDALGGDNTKELELLIKSTDFLIGLYQPGGRKCLQLETKHWYFLSEYEISSNSYDVYSFLRAYECTKNPKYAYYAAEALEQLYAHQLKNGALDDHKGYGVNFQCQHFWNGNTCWLTRIANLVTELNAIEFTLEPHALHFKDSGVINVRTEDAAFIVRGSKVEPRGAMGSKIGGGSLVYVGNSKSNFKDLLGAWTFGYKKVPGNFHAIKKSKEDEHHLPYKTFKALVLYALIELRARSLPGVWQRLKIVGRELLYRRNHYSSMFVCDAAMRLEGTTVTVEGGGLAKWNGEKNPQINLKRQYTLQGENVLVRESLQAGPEGWGSRLYYVLPKKAFAIKVHKGEYKQKNNLIIFSSTSSVIDFEYGL
ncbi:MAG: hypothetical protein RLZZ480_334 [Candidatus Parcubacteria bacterium]|jgi:hypothetical protein